MRMSKEIWMKVKEQSPPECPIGHCPMKKLIDFLAPYFFKELEIWGEDISEYDRILKCKCHNVEEGEGK